MQLNIRGCLVLAVGCGIGACALLPRVSTSPPGRTVVELQDPKFDGAVLAGRLLIGAREGEIIVPADFEAHTWVIVDDLVECGTNLPLPFWFLDPIVVTGREPTRTLPDGHWYGADLRIPVRHPKQLVESLPDCIEVKLAYLPPPDWPLKLKPPVRIWVRVAVPRPTLDVPSAPQPDAGPGEPAHPTPPDGGG